MIMLMMSGGVLVLQGRTDLIYNMQDLKTALVCDGGEIEIFFLQTLELMENKKCLLLPDLLMSLCLILKQLRLKLLLYLCVYCAA